MTTEHSETIVPRQTANRLFLRVEHTLYLALGILLVLTSVLALASAAATLWNGLGEWSSTETVFVVIDRLLFVLMLIEILHTVRVSVESGSLNCEPFLVVGLIASIRRILVITLESSKATHEGNWTDTSEQMFRTSMTELGVLAVLILVMVASIVLLRKTRQRKNGGSNGE
nr:phosphate-starvation-inducible PsiE family protein [uncultured Rhodopila sp.]